MYINKKKKQIKYIYSSNINFNARILNTLLNYFHNSYLIFILKTFDFCVF